MGRGVRYRGLLAALCVTVAAATLGSCATPDQRYKVLSFFFDGVPAPGGDSDLDPKAQAEAADRAKKLAAQAAKLADESTIHPPYAKRECERCHDALSRRIPNKGEPFCFNCHKKTDLGEATNHKPVAAGQCLKCHDPHRADNPSLLKRPVIETCFGCHNPDVDPYLSRHKVLGKTTVCTECHSAHGGKQRGFLKPGSVACVKCHIQDPEAASTHRPVKLGLCPECHLDHRSGKPHNLKGDGEGPICYNCHYKADLSDEVNHFPAAAGECVQCHKPHSSPNPSLLKKPGGGVCFDCHDREGRRFSKFHDRLGDEPVCVRCHNPHGSKRQGFLKSGPEVCGTCHQFTPNPKSVHPPFARGACAKCHLDHDSGKPHNLNPEGEKPICLNCHLKSSLADEVTHFPAAGGECLECHEAHASENPKLLKKPNGGVCFGCHDSQGRRYLQFHKLLGDETRCGTCHNPHGGTRKAFLRPGPEACRICHPAEAAPNSTHAPESQGACEDCHESHREGR